MHRIKTQPIFMKRACAAMGMAAAAVLFAASAHAADPVRGASLYASPARPGFLPCADCHAENPIVNNFGNIWSGRNAAVLIERAVQSNTGGMGVFQGVYGPGELADIAAYLGNAPNAVAFPAAVTGTNGATRTVTISSSLKTGIEGLTLAAEGDFALVGTTCDSSVPRFSSCSVEVIFRPRTPGPRAGTLVIDHAGTPTPIRLPLRGEGLPPPAVAQVQPARIDFGSAGQRRHVEVANFSATPLKLLSLVSSDGFAIAGGTCLPELTLATAQRCTVALRAPPRNVTGQRGTLDIVHDGVGGGSSVELLAAGAPTPNGPLSADLAALEFGTNPLGSTVPALTVNVTNVDASAVTLREVATSDSAFSLEASTCTAGMLLAPGQACQLVVAFRPTRDGPVTAAARVATQEAGPELRISLAARAAASALAVAPGRLGLQAEPGETARAALALVNSGSTPWRIRLFALGGPEAAAFAYSEGAGCGIGASVPPASHCLLTVSFAPGAAGAHSTRLRIETDAGRADVDLAGWGTATAAAEVSLDSSVIDFGTQPVGVAGPAHTITVRNRGGAELRWSQVALSGVDAGSFVLGGDCVSGAAVPAGGSCCIELRFAPAGDGERVATVALWHAGGAAPAAATLRGRGAVIATSVLGSDRARVDFGRWPLIAPAAVQRLRLRNLGGATTPPLSFGIDEPAFAIRNAEASCAAGIAPGASCTIEVAFRAATEGARRGTLTIAGSGLPATVFALSGEAVAAAPALAWQAVNPAPSHGATFVGDPVTGPAWTVVNVGNAPSAPLRWTIDGPAAGDFSLAVASTCESGRTLAPGAGCTVQTVFHPQAAGPRRARLVLASDSLDPATLQGQGSAAALGDLRAAPTSVVFQARTGQAAGPQPVRLVNDAPAVLWIDSLGSEGAAFSFAASSADACGGELRALLPGEACDISVSWDGTAAGALGGRLFAGAAAGFGASVPLAVSEDPAQRSNVGAGGGGAGHWFLLLALAALASARRFLVPAAARAHFARAGYRQ
jgi:hypothetical protein